MNELTIIIQGFNSEKELLTKSLCNIDDFTYQSGIAKLEELNNRLAIIDAKITEIQNSILSPIQTINK